MIMIGFLKNMSSDDMMEFSISATSPVMRAMTSPLRESVRFKRENQKFYKISNRIARRQSLAHPMSEFLGTFTIAIVLWFGGTLILVGNYSLDAGFFIYYMVIFYSIINPAKELSKAVLIL